jgi:hypothetical protein
MNSPFKSHKALTKLLPKSIYKEADLFHLTLHPRLDVLQRNRSGSSVVPVEGMTSIDAISVFLFLCFFFCAFLYVRSD